MHETFKNKVKSSSCFITCDNIDSTVRRHAGASHYYPTINSSKVTARYTWLSELLTDLGRRLGSLGCRSNGESQSERVWSGRSGRKGRDVFLPSGVRRRRAVFLRHCSRAGWTRGRSRNRSRDRVSVRIRISVATRILENNVEGGGGAVAGAARGTQLERVRRVRGVWVSLAVSLRHQAVVAQERMERQVSIVNTETHSTAAAAGKPGPSIDGGLQTISFRSDHR